MEKFIVDRFEENFAVLESENGGTTDVLKAELPDVKKCDVLICENGVYTVCEDETQKRKDLIEEKLRKLFEK